MAALSASSFAVTVNPYTVYRGTTANGFIAYPIGETQPITAATTGAVTRDPGAYAMSPHRVTSAGVTTLYGAVISDGTFDTAAGTAFGGNFGQYDAIGYVMSYSSAGGPLTVTRNLVASATGNSASNTGLCNEMAVGSLDDAGNIALKVMMSTGGTNAFGLIPASSPLTTAFTTSYSTPSNPSQWSLIATSSSSTSLQSVGSLNDWAFSGTFLKQVIAGSPTSTNDGSAYTPHGRVLALITATTYDNRGSVTYNDRAGLAAVLRTKSRTFTVGTNTFTTSHVTAVAIYKVTFDGSGNPVLNDLTGAPSIAGTEITLPQGVYSENNPSSDLTRVDLCGTNYFSSTGFVGPAQISMNDKGDIALAACASNIDDATDSNQSQERGYRQLKRIIMNRYNGSNGYTGWLTVASSGTYSQTVDGSGNLLITPGTGTFVTYNPLLPNEDSTGAAIGLGNPSIDNNDNVYFAACYKAVVFAAGGTAVDTAIFKGYIAAPNQYVTAKVIAENDTITDPISGTSRKVTFLPLAVATSSLSNTNIKFPNANSFGVNSALKDGGGLLVTLKLTDPADDPNNPALPTRWTTIFVTTKPQTPIKVPVGSRGTSAGSTSVGG